MKILPYLVVLSLSVTTVGEAQAQGSWRTVAYKTVNRGDSDTITVRGNPIASQIRLCAVNQPITFSGVTVRFRNGGRQTISLRRLVRAGNCTPAQTLRGRNRNISAIDLRYSQFRRGARLPTVRIQIR